MIKLITALLKKVVDRNPNSCYNSSTKSEKTTPHNRRKMHMSKTEAQANYSAEAVETLVSTYESANTDAERKEAVEMLAQRFGKTTRSVIAKLSSLGVYQKAEKVTKTGSKVETKAEIVSEIATILSVDAEALASLANASKASLNALRSAVQ